MNKKAVAIIVAAGVIVLALGGFAAYRLTRSDSAGKQGANGKGGTPTGGYVVDKDGNLVQIPNPADTVLPPDTEQRGDEPIFLPKDQLPIVELPEGSADNLSMKTTGGIRQSQTSTGTVICGPQPSPEYWIQIADGRLGDRTYGMNFTIKDFKGPGSYTTVVGMAMKYPDGELFPFADGEAKVEVRPPSDNGTIKAEFQFREGLVSVSIVYRCAAGASS